MVLSQYQQNLLENQNKKIQRIFSLVPLLMENCKNVIMGPYGDFNITPKYQNINKHHKDILCTRVYNNIFKVLYEIDSPQVSDDIDFGVYDLHLDHTKFLGPQIKTSELKKVNQDLIKILRDEKNNPEINVRKIKVKEQKDKIVSDILKNVPIIEDCLHNENTDCKQLCNDIRYTIFGDNELSYEYPISITPRYSHLERILQDKYFKSNTIKVVNDEFIMRVNKAKEEYQSNNKI